MARVAVAMSGGVDSAVSAALLREEGHDVIGVHMIIGGAESAAGVSHVRAVADALEIPLTTIDLSASFRREVVDYFVCAYRRGRTPNPCAVCNPRIKFGLLRDRALAAGADVFATGHYVRTRREGLSGRTLLLKGADAKKDQSYFLHRLTSEQLAGSLFPLGTFTKDRVRDMAAERSIGGLTTPESQEFCFMGDENYKRFVESAGEPEPGDIVDIHGNVLGRHGGIHRYTVGQRRGLNLPSTEPYYVVAIDPAERRVVIGRNSDLFSRKMLVGDVHWIVDEPVGPFRAAARVRFRHREAPALLEPGAPGEVRVTFDQPVRAVTPGQAAVFYDGDTVLGGGWIVRADGEGEREHDGGT